MQKKFKVIDLFSGVGGLSYGFVHDNDFEIIGANELLPKMAKAYELNHPAVKVYCKDIKNFGLDDLKKDFDIKKGEIDLIVGGPPCQAYSTVGKRIIDDPRGELFQEYYRVLREINPKVFLFENVKGLLSMQNGELLSTIISLFESLDYKVSYKTLNSADYGVPQIRERVIIIGTKLNSKFDYPEATHYNPENEKNLLTQNLKPYLLLSDAISDLPFIKSGEESFQYFKEPINEFQKLMRKNAPKLLMDHNAPKNNEKLIQLMEQLPDGGTPNDLPKELRPKSGFANTYCRLWWNRPSTTITRNLSTPSSSRCIHPKAPRPLTTREGARIQCFPDNYIFYGSRSDKNLQIGNAVPTFLSIALKNSIKRHFMNHLKQQEDKKFATAVIFAGGKSSRMGEDKALLDFDGVSLSEFQYNRLSKLFNKVYLSSKEDKFDFNAPLIYDNHAISSPMVALDSIFEATTEGEIFILSVDMPFVSHELIELLFSQNSNEFDVIVAHSVMGREPLCGIYKRSSCDTIKAFLAQDNHKLNALLKNLRTKDVVYDDEMDFKNLNFKSDYKEALDKMLKK